MNTEYTYTRISSIETPAQGVLNQAKDRKKKLHTKIKLLKQRIKDNPLHNFNLKIELIKLKSLHNEAILAEKQAKDMIEKRANELGLTTIKVKK